MMTGTKISSQKLLSLTILSWRPILENIESRFDSYLEQENRVNRQKIVDNRVHACLYFIQPTGHSYVLSPLPCPLLTSPSSLKQIDIEFMRRLHTRVNLIPIIAKADTLTDEEITDFKARVHHPHPSSLASLDLSSFRFLLTSPTTRFKFSRLPPMKMKMRKHSQRQRKSLARSLLLSSVQIMSSRHQMVVKSAVVHTPGASSR